MNCTISSSFNSDGTNTGSKCNDNNIDNLSGPTNLSFIQNQSSNSDNKTIHNIKIVKRFNQEYHIVNINSQVQISNPEEANHINKTKIIHPTHKRWWLKVPVEIKKGKKSWIRMLGDSAADKPCANYDWAVQYFREQICLDKEPVIIHTGGGTVKPKYCIWLSFPAADGSAFSAKFVLLKFLPAPILADMNVLEEFGYTFKNEIPPIFRTKNIDKSFKFYHPSQPDLDIDLKEGDEKFKSIKVSIEKNWRNSNNLINGSYNNECKSDDDNKYDSDNDYIYNVNNTKHKPLKIDKIKCLSELIYESDNKTDSDDWKDEFYFIQDTDEDKHILNCVNIDAKHYKIPCNELSNTYKGNNLMNNSDFNINNSKFDNIHKKYNNDYQNNFITMNPSLKASTFELTEAKKHNYNKQLKDTNLSYLKMLEKWKPRQYAHLYDRTIEFREKWKKIGKLCPQ